MPTIYEPKGQAGEYSPWAANPYYGCGHKCAYCYVPRIPGQPDRKTFDAGAILKPGYLDTLRRDAAKMQRDGKSGHQVMISFTSDPYHPLDTEPTRRCWEILIEHGFAICALSKGGTRALRDIELFRPSHDAYACTLTSLDPVFSDTWERGAALPDDRIAALKAFRRRGIFTWVSLEPTLDVDASLAIVDATHEFVDLYKVGRVNYNNITRTTDWKDYTLRMIDKLQHYGNAHYIKKDLQPFLPRGYHNPLRVPQHH
jgi:DNA repair photolyase